MGRGSVPRNCHCGTALFFWPALTYPPVRIGGMREQFTVPKSHWGIPAGDPFEMFESCEHNHAAACELFTESDSSSNRKLMSPVFKSRGTVDYAPAIVAGGERLSTSYATFSFLEVSVFRPRMAAKAHRLA